MNATGPTALTSNTSGPWPVVRLGEVLTQRKEFIRIDDTREYVRCRVQLHAKGIVLRDRVEGALIKTKDQQVCRAGEFLVAEIDAKVGGFGVVPPELDGSIVSSHYFLFAVDPHRLDQRFLEYYSKTPAFRDQVRAQGSTNYAAIRPAHVLGYTVPLPPRSEQRRIRAKLDDLFAKVAEARRLADNRAHVVGKLAASYSYHLFATHRRVGTIPLGEISDIQAGVTLGRNLGGRTVELPYLRVANVQGGYLDLSVVKKVSVLPTEIHKWQLQRGDLLLTEGGDWDKLGRGALWQGEIPDCIHQNHIFRVRVDQARFDPSYVLALTNSPYGRDYFQDASKQTTNLASINQRQLKAFPVLNLPLDAQASVLERQRALTEKLTAVSRLSSAAELDALTPALLNRAFKGDL